jgi:DNA-binding transcriptional MerR regulator
MEKLRQIHYLVKERGFTLEGARAKLRHAPEDQIDHEDVVRRLQKVKAELDQFAKTIKTLP